MCVYIYIHIHSYFSTLNFPAFIFPRPSVFFKEMFVFQGHIFPQGCSIAYLTSFLF